MVVQESGIVLPRPHFSYSQLSLWMRSRDQYRARYYVPDAVPFENRETIFGKKVAKMLEGRDIDSVGKEYPFLVPILEKYEISEHPLEAMIGGVKVVAYLDLFRKEENGIGEVKTGHATRGGSAPWDKVKVLKHDQLPMYSMLVKEVMGAVDPWLELFWLETEFGKKSVEFDGHVLEDGVGDLRLTGRVGTFRRRIAQWEHKRIRDMIGQATREISEDYIAWRGHASET